MYRIGIDLGGTNIAAGIVNEAYEIICQESVPTGADRSSEAIADDMAALCYLSRYHFMRLFKAQTGCTVHNYIRQKRLVLAARLIREGMSASAAAAECGFVDYSAFHRAFTKTFRVSPGRIKKQ